MTLALQYVVLGEADLFLGQGALMLGEAAPVEAHFVLQRVQGSTALLVAVIDGVVVGAQVVIAAALHAMLAVTCLVTILLGWNLVLYLAQFAALEGASLALDLVAHMQVVLGVGHRGIAMLRDLLLLVRRDLLVDVVVARDYSRVGLALLRESRV